MAAAKKERSEDGGRIDFILVEKPASPKQGDNSPPPSPPSPQPPASQGLRLNTPRSLKPISAEDMKNSHNGLAGNGTVGKHKHRVDP